MERQKTIILYSAPKPKIESEHLTVRKRENGNDPSTNAVANGLLSLRQPSKTAKEHVDGNMGTITAVVQHSLKNIPVEHEKRQYVIEKIKSMVNRPGKESSSAVGSRLAEIIERHLYQQATSFQEYSDVSTFHTRLRKVSADALRRRLGRMNTAKNQCRRELFEKHLGIRKYAELVTLCQQVRKLHAKFAQESCASCKETSSSSVAPRLEPDSKAPTQIVNLFLRTLLCTKIKQIPVELIPETDWDDLERQARDNIKAYKEWMKKD